MKCIQLREKAIEIHSRFRYRSPNDTRRQDWEERRRKQIETLKLSVLKKVLITTSSFMNLTIITNHLLLTITTFQLEA